MSVVALVSCKWVRIDHTSAKKPSVTLMPRSLCLVHHDHQPDAALIREHGIGDEFVRKPRRNTRDDQDRAHEDRERLSP
jgi:hypothetical protein